MTFLSQCFSLPCIESMARRMEPSFVGGPTWLAIFLLLVLPGAVAHAQANEWTWMAGNSSMLYMGSSYGQPGVYGTQGTPAQGNSPGSRISAASWTDSRGNLWLFGGYGLDSSNQSGYLDDLWEFDTSLGQWAWIGGSETLPTCGTPGYCGEPGIYGNLGSPAPSNAPGGRTSASSCTDDKGNLWLFGGGGFYASQFGYLNDVWQFNPSTREWAWIGGSNTFNNEQYVPGVYGTLGQPATGNIPGGRYGAICWADKSGHFWLYGGNGYDGYSYGNFNDLWEFDSSTNEWAWLTGSNTIGQNSGHPSVYGNLRTPNALNTPGGRLNSANWKDSQGHLWLFGGYGVGAGTYADVNADLNDLWEFDPSTHEWAWMGGSGGNIDFGGVYGTLKTPDPANIPGSREAGASWTDSDGNLWLFAGYGYDINDTIGYLNDLWEFNPSSTEWTWIAGGEVAHWGTNSIPGVPGVYGELGIPSARNFPGGRQLASTWIDTNGNLWLFGGSGFDSTGLPSYLNDLWRYQFKPAAAVPTLSVTSGTYAAPQTVKLSDATTGATIYYTVDGSNPTNKSAQYSSALLIDRTTTVQAIAEASGYTNSYLASATYTIIKPQTIVFAQPISPVAYGAKLPALSATANSGLAVVFKVVSGPATVNGSTLVTAGVGTVVIAANQAGNAVFAAAPQVTRTIIVDKATQAIAFTQPTSPVLYGVKPIRLSAKATSGLPVTFGMLSGPGKISGSTLTITGVGTVVVAAYQSGNANFLAAPKVTQTIVVNKAPQSISFPQPVSPVVYGVKPIALSATARSGGAVTFSVLSGPGKISGTLLTVTGAGSIVIAANQPGNADYIAAAQVSHTINVGKAKLTIAANNLSIKQGAAVPTLTYTTTGFVNGDSPAKAITGLPVLSTTATSKSAPGTYPITVKTGTLVAPNYTFTFVNGAITVTQ